MVISDEYRYLFVELPKTGSTSIHRELVRNYGGKRILHKHSLYHHFLEVASEDQKKYFVFSSIRNPLDQTVSHYLGYKMDWLLGFQKLKSPPKRWHLISGYHQRRHRYVQENNADFPTYFRKFYRFPYGNWSILDHANFDFILRFENLDQDFEKLLQKMDVPQKCPLPRANITPGKGTDFLSYYTPEIRDLAKYVFGPFMGLWGYDFPTDWGETNIPKSAWITFRALNLARKFYWRRLYLHPKLDLTARRPVKQFLP